MYHPVAKPDFPDTLVLWWGAAGVVVPARLSVGHIEIWPLLAKLPEPGEVIIFIEFPVFETGEELQKFSFSGCG